MSCFGIWVVDKVCVSLGDFDMTFENVCFAPQSIKVLIGYYYYY